MSSSQPHKYKLYYLINTWNEDYYQEIGYSYMSAMPSKDQIIKALQGANQLDGLSNEYMVGITKLLEFANIMIRKIAFGNLNHIREGRHEF